jgi:hypothetical protein
MKYWSKINKLCVWLYEQQVSANLAVDCSLCHQIDPPNTVGGAVHVVVIVYPEWRVVVAV